MNEKTDSPDLSVEQVAGIGAELPASGLIRRPGESVGGVMGGQSPINGSSVTLAAVVARLDVGAIG